MDDRIEAVALLRDLARAKAAFQLRAIEAALCASAQSKPDQETAVRTPDTDKAE